METKKLPTAEELAIEMFIKHPGSYSSFNRVLFTGKQLKAVAVALAKLHVEAAIEKCTVKSPKYIWRNEGITDKETFLNELLDNIK